jgi:hypothetical protein
MSDLPERITATFKNWRNPNAGVCYKNDAGDIEYIRADTVKAQIDAAVKALEAIRELNTSKKDYHGHRWAHSDLIAQEIVAALAAIRKGNSHDHRQAD